MDQKSSGVSLILFLVGLLSRTQISIGGKIGISELCMVIASPFVFLKCLPSLRREGVLWFFTLPLLWLGGALYVDISTHNYLPYILRGIAVPITVFSSMVCIFALLRKDMDAIKWLLLGSALSGVISIFVFQGGEAGDVAAEYGLEAGAQSVIGYKLFWVNQLTAWLILPIAGWYLKVPKLYSILALAFIAIFDLLSGGRSAFLATSLSLVIICFSGKTKISMRMIKEHMILMSFVVLLVAFVGKEVYKYAASTGLMGEYEEAKYEKQVNEGDGALAMLMSSRSEFFIGLQAALDHPFKGNGSVAIDNYGYIVDFIRAHGSNADLENILKVRAKYGVRIIPAHSHIINYWMWHGLFALVFWATVLVMAIQTLFRRIDVYVPWIGYFATSIPIFLWDIFFSPFGSRVQKSALFVAFLIVSKMAKNEDRVKRSSRKLIS